MHQFLIILTPYAAADTTLSSGVQVKYANLTMQTPNLEPLTCSCGKQPQARASDAYISRLAVAPSGVGMHAPFA